MTLRTGKLPATYDRRDLLHASYRQSSLKTAPIGFGHRALVKHPWGMLGNDQWGDCALAGPGHEHMLTSACAGHQITFTDQAILAAYSAITGFDPNAGPPGDNPTDQGSNVRDVLQYRRATGLADAEGATHKIGAYVALEPGNWNQLLEALYAFEAVGIGIQFPESAMNQFNAGQPWSVVPGAQIEGGHYIPAIGRRTLDDITVITWGRPQLMTKAFYAKYCDEAWAILSPEMLAGDKSLEGFNLAQLNADLADL